MQPRHDYAGYSAAFTVWCELGGDKALFHSLWPLVRTRLKPAPRSPFTRRGQCCDCEIYAGPTYLTPGLNKAGRCESCQHFFDRFGPILKRSADDADASLERRQSA